MNEIINVKVVETNPKPVGQLQTLTETELTVVVVQVPEF